MNNLATAEKLVQEAYAKAVSLNKKFNSPHEGFCVIRDKYKDLEHEVFKPYLERDLCRMQKEAAQVAAMAIRFIVDCTMKRKDNRIVGINPTEGHGDLL